MKKKIMGIMIPFVLSVLCGYVCGKIVYRIYKDDINDKFNSSLVYLLEGGTYLTYDGMRMDNVDGDYVYYVDGNEYKTVYGITRDIDNVDKINNVYNGDLNVLKYYVSNDKLNSKQEEYDSLLKDSVLEKDIKSVIGNILDMYREGDGVRLVLID